MQRRRTSGRGRRRRRQRSQAGQFEATRATSGATARAERLRTRRRRRAVALVMFALAAVVASTHVLEHAGALRLFNPGLEDILIGFPTAFGLLVVGGIALGP